MARSAASRASNTSSAASQRADSMLATACSAAGVSTTQHRTAVGGIGHPDDEAGRLERLDGGGRRARHDAEPGRQLRHPGCVRGVAERAQEPGLRVGEPEGREPPRAAAGGAPPRPG